MNRSDTATDCCPCPPQKCWITPIIFFDWEYNGYTGTADHVGIVEKVVGNTIYTIEGNSGDECQERTYDIGYVEILGFGVPAY